MDPLIRGAGPPYPRFLPLEQVHIGILTLFITFKILWISLTLAGLQNVLALLLFIACSLSSPHRCRRDVFLVEAKRINKIDQACPGYNIAITNN